MVKRHELDQGAVNTHISSIFGIETGFQGTLISKMAKVQDQPMGWKNRSMKTNNSVLHLILTTGVLILNS
jgi:hypothetical protein